MEGNSLRSKGGSNTAMTVRYIDCRVELKSSSIKSEKQC